MSKVSTSAIREQAQAVYTRLKPKFEQQTQKFLQQCQEVATRLEDIPAEYHIANSVLIKKQPKSIVSKLNRTEI